jgi:hypothetical protein
MEAVKKDGYVIQYFSDELRKNAELVMIAVKN